jgi:hypothetical protein
MIASTRSTATVRITRCSIVGFAWFVITGDPGNGQRVTATGEFVGLETADLNATLGADTHPPDGATSVELTN